MTETVKCPSCDVVLPDAELDDGWCDACGKKIPQFIYEKAGMEAPSERTLSRMHWDKPMEGPQEKESLPIWQLSVIGVFVLALAVVIVRAMILMN